MHDGVDPVLARSIRATRAWSPTSPGHQGRLRRDGLAKPGREIVEHHDLLAGIQQAPAPCGCRYSPRRPSPEPPCRNASAVSFVVQAYRNASASIQVHPLADPPSREKGFRAKRGHMHSAASPVSRTPSDVALDSSALARSSLACSSLHAGSPPPKHGSLSMKRIRKAVLPVAGLGTRFLPATKAVPKEMMTVVDRPVVQHVVDEAQGRRNRAFHLRHRPQQGGHRGSFRHRLRA